MIKHTVSNRRENITYYFHQQQRYEYAIGNPYGENSIQMIQQSHTAYDNLNHRFVKERGGNEEVMNAMLLVKRFKLRYGQLSAELLSLVEDHV